jgi:hypothetical protein
MSEFRCACGNRHEQKIPKHFSFEFAHPRNKTFGRGKQICGNCRGIVEDYPGIGYHEFLDLIAGKGDRLQIEVF